MVISKSSGEATAACSRVRRGHQRRDVRDGRPARPQPGVALGACRRAIQSPRRSGSPRWRSWCSPTRLINVAQAAVTSEVSSRRSGTPASSISSARFRVNPYASRTISCVGCSASSTASRAGTHFVPPGSRRARRGTVHRRGGRRHRSYVRRSGLTSTPKQTGDSGRIFESGSTSARQSAGLIGSASTPVSEGGRGCRAARSRTPAAN